MIDRNNDRNMLGRVIALAVLLGSVYGVRAISRGGLGCPLGAGGSSCCAMSAHHEEGSEKAEAAEKEEPSEKSKPAAKAEKPTPAATHGERPAPAEPVTDSNDD